MLCAPLKHPTLPAVEEANKEADLVEFQCDNIPFSTLQRLKKACTKPVIFKFEKLIEEYLFLKPDFIDLPHTTPLAHWQRLANSYPEIKRICSYHDFEKTESLETIYSKMTQYPAHIFKLATWARSSLDALKMLKLVKAKKCIGLCMGEEGAITRILGPCFGAPWTYAPLCEEQKTAPGQLLLSELVQRYRIREHSDTTALFGLMGDPVQQSPGHTMHNFAFARLQLDALYVKMRVPQEALADSLSLCRELGFKGLSITIPLKEVLSQYLNLNNCPSVNTIVFHQEGLEAFSTDGLGALSALEKKVSVEGKHIVILGAGGSAWSIAQEAKLRGAKLTILNRTMPRAQALAQAVGGRFGAIHDFPEVAKKGYDILINATSVGMGDSGLSPVSPEALLEGRWVMDMVSSSTLTPFLQAAKAKNCPIIDGLEVFVQQAVFQYCHWFGVENG